MDLYKHAFRLAPLIPAELVADAFPLAWDIRIVGMWAAPYGFSGLRLDPEDTGPDRDSRPRLIEECERLLEN